jgi:hypothetical protein
LVFVGFVGFGEFGAEFVFGDIGAVGVEDITSGNMRVRDGDGRGVWGLRGYYGRYGDRRTRPFAFARGVGCG